MKGWKIYARFTNQAQLRYGNNIANSNIAVGEILEVLSAMKTAVQKHLQSKRYNNLCGEHRKLRKYRNKRSDNFLTI